MGEHGLACVGMVWQLRRACAWRAAAASTSGLRKPAAAKAASCRPVASRTGGNLHTVRWYGMPACSMQRRQQQQVLQQCCLVSCGDLQGLECLGHLLPPLLSIVGMCTARLHGRFPCRGSRVVYVVAAHVSL